MLTRKKGIILSGKQKVEKCYLIAKERYGKNATKGASNSVGADLNEAHLYQSFYQINDNLNEK